MTHKEIYNNIWDLFLASRSDLKNYGGKIIVSDEPRQLLLGWANLSARGESPHRYYRLKVSDIKARRALKLPFENIKIEETLLDLIRSTGGRATLANILNSDKEPNMLIENFERYLKLKAFW